MTRLTFSNHIFTFVLSPDEKPKGCKEEHRSKHSLDCYKVITLHKTDSFNDNFW